MKTIKLSFVFLVLLALTTNVLAQDLHSEKIASEAEEQVVQVKTILFLSDGMSLEGSGAGFFVDKSGLVVTANHVVDIDALTIEQLKLRGWEIKKIEYWIILSKKHLKFKAEVLGQNPYYDQALLK